MKTNDPKTWLNLSDHPIFSGGEFDPSWYDGDPVADLQMLRNLATEVLSRFGQCRTELQVLDDCTMFVTITHNGKLLCSIYPACTLDYQPCYFVDIEGDPAEHRRATVSDVIDLLQTAISKY